MMERTSDLHISEQRTLNELIHSKRMGGWKRLRKTLELAALMQAESGKGSVESWICDNILIRRYVEWMAEAIKPPIQDWPVGMMRAKARFI